MASRRSLSPGGSYGRAQVIISWALSNWEFFDAWCCIKNIDPVYLSVYRFYNLALFCYKENLTEVQLLELELTLLECDDIQNPLQAISVRRNGNKIFPVIKEQEAASSSQSPEARHKYIPPWWQGEEKAYETAKVAMGGISALPKMQQ